MNTPVFLAVLAAALLHATWNALLKGGPDKRMGMAAVVLGHLPFALAVAPFVPLPPPSSFPYLGAGIVLHFGYQIFLMRSYEEGDLTQVYPIARGSAPLLVAGVSVVFLGVRLSPIELLAVGIIAAGIWSLAIARRHDGQRNAHAARLALITGGFIASYSLVDGMGARVAGHSLGFFAWLAIGDGLLMAAFVLATDPGILKRIARHGRGLFVVGGGASFVAYALVTWAFTQAPIALVAALRETSITFALLIGVFGLGERLDLAKVFSTFATLLGAALLRLAKPA